MFSWRSKNKEHETLFKRIPWLNDPQSAWLLLLMCASTGAHFWLRAPGMAKVLASLSFSVGGLGLSSAHRNREGAHWASWDDCLRMVHDRHPDIAETMITQLRCRTVTCFEGVQRCRRLVEDAGLEGSFWEGTGRNTSITGGGPRTGSAQVWVATEATRMVEQSFVHTQVWPGLNGPTRALLRSQHGPLASAPFTALPTSRVTKFDAQPFSHAHLPMWPPT